MSYTKQNFMGGQTLRAAHLNAMDAGIEANDLAIAELSENVAAKSKPIPFAKSDNGNYICGITFNEAHEYCTGGFNQVNATLFQNKFNSSTTSLEMTTTFAHSVTYADSLATDLPLWIKADFRMTDGTVVELKFYPDETVTEISDDPV